jgi:hypothetical protein
MSCTMTPINRTLAIDPSLAPKAAHHGKTIFARKS